MQVCAMCHVPEAPPPTSHWTKEVTRPSVGGTGQSGGQSAGKVPAGRRTSVRNLICLPASTHGGCGQGRV